MMSSVAARCRAGSGSNSIAAVHVRPGCAPRRVPMASARPVTAPPLEPNTSVDSAPRASMRAARSSARSAGVASCADRRWCCWQAAGIVGDHGVIAGQRVRQWAKSAEAIGEPTTRTNGPSRGSRSEARAGNSTMRTVRPCVDVIREQTAAGPRNHRGDATGPTRSRLPRGAAATRGRSPSFPFGRRRRRTARRGGSRTRRARSRRTGPADGRRTALRSTVSSSEYSPTSRSSSTARSSWSRSTESGPSARSSARPVRTYTFSSVTLTSQRPVGGCRADVVVGAQLGQVVVVLVGEVAGQRPFGREHADAAVAAQEDRLVVVVAAQREVAA